MANAQLDFNEEQLDKTSDLYYLYDKLYQGMVKANEVDPPVFPSSDDLLVLDSNGNPVFDSNGEPVINQDKKAEIDKMSSNFSTILMKNSAYLFANSILSVVDGIGGGGEETGPTGFVSRGGDSMKGALSAWYGFDAGVNGQKIFEVSIDSKENKWAIVHGGLNVKGNVDITGVLNFGDGIAFDGNKSIYLNNNSLVIERQDISVKGNIDVDGVFTLKNIIINKDGIFWNKHEFYHSGNSNKIDVDWTMKSANIHENITVKQNSLIEGSLTVDNGFSLKCNQMVMFYSEIIDQVGEAGEVVQINRAVLDSDLRIINGHGIKLDENYIIHVRNNKVVSFSAPGMIMNLGDSDNGKQTNKISLQSDIWDYSNSFKLISKEGTGNFVNGLRVQCAVNGSSVLESFRTDAFNLGILLPHQIRFGTVDGPAIYKDDSTERLNILIPYVNGEVDEHPTEHLMFSTFFEQTTSPFRDKHLDWSATLHFLTDGEFFAFDKPIEANYFAIKSDQYHTRLIEDALFFDDGKFIEGVVDGIRYAGNGYFDGSISSPSFASGFAGYGWGVKEEITNGGFHATFDALTVRKKMRIYELEVQKIYGTNGSLWVSDSCSGDEVIAL